MVAQQLGPLALNVQVKDSHGINPSAVHVWLPVRPFSCGEVPLSGMEPFPSEIKIRN
jgi:hypothetical protein